MAVFFGPSTHLKKKYVKYFTSFQQIVISCSLRRFFSLSYFTHINNLHTSRKRKKNMNSPSRNSKLDNGIAKSASGKEPHSTSNLNPYRVHTKELASARLATEAMDKIQLACQELVMAADFASFGIGTEAIHLEKSQNDSEGFSNSSQSRRRPTPQNVKEQVQLALKDSENMHAATDDTGHTATETLAVVIDQLQSAVVNIEAIFPNQTDITKSSVNKLSTGIIGSEDYKNPRTNASDAASTADAAWPEMATSFQMLRELLQLTRIGDVPVMHMGGDKPVMVHIANPAHTGASNSDATLHLSAQKPVLTRYVNPGDELVSAQWVTNCLKNIRTLARRVMMSVQQFSYAHSAALQLLSQAETTHLTTGDVNTKKSNASAYSSPTIPSQIPPQIASPTADVGTYLWCTSLAPARKLKAHLLGPEYDMTRAVFRTLVRGVVNRSLSGRVVCESEDGTAFMIAFRTAWEALTFDACLHRFAMYLPWPKACLALSYAGEQLNPVAEVTVQALAKDASDWVAEAARKIDVYEIATNNANVKAASNTLLPISQPAPKSSVGAPLPDTFTGVATKQSFSHAEIKEIRNLRSRVTATENLFIGQVEMLNGQAEARALALKERQTERDRMRFIRENKKAQKEGSNLESQSVKDPDFENETKNMEEIMPQQELDSNSGDDKLANEPVDIDFIPKPPQPLPGTEGAMSNTSPVLAAAAKMTRYSIYARRGPVIRSAIHLAGEDPKFTAVSSMQLVVTAMCQLSDGFATLLGPQVMNKNAAMVMEALRCQTHEAALDGFLLEREDKDVLLSEPNMMSIADLKGNGVGYLYGAVWHPLRFRKRKATKDFNPTAVADRWWWCTRTVPTLAVSIQGTTSAQGFARGTQTEVNENESAPTQENNSQPARTRSGSPTRRSKSPKSETTPKSTKIPNPPPLSSDNEKDKTKTSARRKLSLRAGGKRTAKRSESPLQPPEPSPTPIPRNAEVGCQTRNGSSDIAEILQLRDSLTKIQTTGNTTPGGRRRSLVPNANELASRTSLDQKVSAFASVLHSEPSSFGFNGFTAAVLKCCQLFYDWIEGRSSDEEIVSFLEHKLLNLDDSITVSEKTAIKDKKHRLASGMLHSVSELNESSNASLSVYEAALHNEATLIPPTQAEYFAPFNRSIPTTDAAFPTHVSSHIADMLVGKFGLSPTDNHKAGGSPVNSPSTAISSPTGGVPRPNVIFPSGQTTMNNTAVPLRVPKPPEPLFRPMNPAWKRISSHYRNIMTCLGGPLSTDDSLVAGAGLAAIFHMVAELVQDQSRHCEEHRIIVHELQTELFNVTSAALKGPHATFVKSKITSALGSSSLPITQTTATQRAINGSIAHSLGASATRF